MNAEPRAIQDPLPDLPLIREELLVRIERRLRQGASRSELRDLRNQYDEVTRRRRS